MALRSPLTVQPYDYIGDSTGRPLDKGQIYIGVAGQDPEFYQIPVFLDAEMTKPIDQPIRTNDGFVDFAGSLSELYASAEVYSVKVLDKQGRKVIYKAEMMRDNLTDDALQSLDDAIAESQAQAVITTTEVVNEAIDDIMLGEYQTQLEAKVDGISGGVDTLSDDISDLSVDVSAQKLDTGITATPQYVGAVPRTLADKNSDTINVRDFGAKGDGVTDDSSAIEKAVNTGRMVHFPKGDYVVRRTIVTTDFMMDFADGAEIVATNGVFDGFVFSAKGTATEISALSSDANKFGHIISINDNLSLNFDDWLMIYDTTDYSYSPHRPYYRAGEFVKVESVAGNNIKLQGALYDSYAAGVKLYAVNPINVNLKNVKIRCDGSAVTGVAIIEYAREPVIDKCRIATDGSITGLVVSRSLDMSITSSKVTNKGNDNNYIYGLQIRNCQGGGVTGGEYYAKRNGTDMGGTGDIGGIPNRGVTITGAKISNNKASATKAATFHGNSEHCAYINNTIIGGIGIMGADNRFIGNTMYSGISYGVLVYGDEILGGTHTIQDNTFYADVDPWTATMGLIDFGGNHQGCINESTAKDVTIIFDGNTVVSDVLSTNTRLLWINNFGCTKKINVRCENNVFDVNNLLCVGYMNAISGTVASDFIIIDNNIYNGVASVTTLRPDATTTTGNYYELPVLRLQENNWKDTVSTIVGSNFISAPTYDFRWKYPRPPSARCDIASDIVLDKDVAQARISKLNNTQGRVTLALQKGVMFDSAAEVRICATAYIKEV